MWPQSLIASCVYSALCERCFRICNGIVHEIIIIVYVMIYCNPQFPTHIHADVYQYIQRYLYRYFCLFYFCTWFQLIITQPNIVDDIIEIAYCSCFGLNTCSANLLQPWTKYTYCLLELRYSVLFILLRIFANSNYTEPAKLRTNWFLGLNLCGTNMRRRHRIWNWTS